MVKFSDSLGDFVALVSEVSIRAQLEGDSKQVHQSTVAWIKEQPQFETVVRRWESAARMRQWINEKKHQTSQELEKKVREELRKKKAEEKKKKEEEAEAAPAEGKEGAEKADKEKDETEENKEAPKEAEAAE